MSDIDNFKVNNQEELNPELVKAVKPVTDNEIDDFIEACYIDKDEQYNLEKIEKFIAENLPKEELIAWKFAVLYAGQTHGNYDPVTLFCRAGQRWRLEAFKI